MLKKKEQFSLTTFSFCRKCVFCGSYKAYRTKRGYIKCEKCKKQKGSKILKNKLSFKSDHSLKWFGKR